MKCPTLSDLPAPPPGKVGWPWTEESPQAPKTAPDGSAWPGITVVTPSFNQAMYVEATLRSVLLQGYPELEYIVIDGGSTDQSVEIIRKYERFVTYWISEKDRGQSEAINKGFARATGTIINWLNSDDRLMPGALAEVALMALKDPEAVGWAGSVRAVDPAGTLIRMLPAWGMTQRELIQWWPKAHVCQPGCYFSKRASTEIGPIAEDLHYVMDVDYWVRLAGLGRFVSTKSTLAEATLHEAAKTVSQYGNARAELHLIQIRHGHEAVALGQMKNEVDRLEEFRGYMKRPIRTALRWRLKGLLGRFRRA